MDRDVQQIFLFESGLIGLLGGVFGLILAWVGSGIINQVVCQESVASIGYPGEEVISLLELCSPIVRHPVMVAVVWPVSRDFVHIGFALWAKTHPTLLQGSRKMVGGAAATVGQSDGQTECGYGLHVVIAGRGGRGAASSR